MGDFVSPYEAHRASAFESLRAAAKAEKAMNKQPEYHPARLTLKMAAESARELASSELRLCAEMRAEE